MALARPALAIEIPPLTGHVVDRAQLLDAATRSELEERLTRFERDTGHQIVVHTTPSLEGLDIVSYAIEIGDAWKVGQKGLDNGVILTIAPNERQMRIDVGYGLGGVIPDALASRVIRDTLAPAFREQRMADGIRAAVDDLLKLASGEVVARRPVAPRRDRNRSLFYLIFLLLFFAPYLLRGGSGAALGPGQRRIRRGFGFPPGPGGFGGGGFGGGGLGGGGGFSGGGGRFGGGGASGSW